MEWSRRHKRCTCVFAFLTCVAVGFLAGAPSVGAQDAVSTRFRREFQARFPKVNILAIRPSGIGDLREVQTTQGLLYTDRTGRFLVLGRIVDLQSGTDLTAQRWQELHRVPFSKLPLSLAIKLVHGNGQRKLAVFEDPDCPYCHQLERQLAGIDNVTIYTFLYPVEGLHPGASEKARRIWCAPDRAAAWVNWMSRGLLPSGAHCPGDDLEKQQQLGVRVGVIATPTLVFERGQQHVGTMKRAAIEQALHDSLGDRRSFP